MENRKNPPQCGPPQCGIDKKRNRNPPQCERSIENRKNPPQCGPPQCGRYRSVVHRRVADGKIRKIKKLVG